MKLYCPYGCQIDGNEYYKTRHMNPEPDEANCPECWRRFITGMERNARKKASRNNGRLRTYTPLEAAAAEEFHDRVCSGEVCWARELREGHQCSGGELQSHHLIEAQWWRRIFGDLPREELLKLVYNPIIGAPLCPGFHSAVTAKRERIYFEELDRELIEHCERLDIEYPNRGVLARLELESPFRKAAA